MDAQSIRPARIQHSLVHESRRVEHAVDMNARRGFITVIRYPSYLAETRIQKYKVAGRKSAFFKI